MLGAGAAGYLFRTGVLSAETIIRFASKAYRTCLPPHPRHAKRNPCGAGVEAARLLRFGQADIELGEQSVS
jgi:hypothetical protein